MMPVKVPICGHVFWMVTSLTDVVQLWLEFPDTASPSSGTGLNGDCWLELEV
jgi:hypothetical protein